jgi:thiosulfate dehydrogenase [quinone] large subunit
MDPGLALLPLRLFLGITFVYAGVQKLSDPGYLHPGAPTYIGTQLHGFAHGTPGGFLLRTFALPHPQLVGVVTALVEIAVGLLVTAGLLTRLAAVVGLGLNVVLFLTNSWNAYPYFLGSDIVFVFAWLPLVLAGAAGQPALDNQLERASYSPRLGGGGGALTRRAVIARGLGAAGLATLGLGGISALTKGRYSKPTKSLGAGTSPKTAAAAPTPPATTAAPAGPKVPANAVKLGPSSRLPRGEAATYSDPSGGTGIVIRKPGGGLTAFSAICTHAGCTVGYQNGQLVCPCHGGTFDASTGAVISGPPPTGLPKRRVLEAGGDIYALRA